MDFSATPPLEIVSGDTFMVNFTLTASDEFFDWGVLEDTQYGRQYGPVFKNFG